MEIGGEPRDLSPGETVEVPIDTTHRDIHNPSDADALVRLTLPVVAAIGRLRGYRPSY